MLLDGTWSGWGLWQAGISAGAGLVGALIGGYVTANSQKVEWR